MDVVALTETWLNEMDSAVRVEATPTVDFQKSPSLDFIWRGTSLDFVARGRPLRGQTRLAPLAKRSTCSKSTSTGFKFHDHPRRVRTGGGTPAVSCQGIHHSKTVCGNSL